jgi:hypothetical protein
MFTVWQIKKELFLEDISNLLNSGEIPNIFTADEKNDICEKMREFDKQRDKSVQVRFLICCDHANNTKLWKFILGLHFSASLGCSMAT